MGIWAEHICCRFLPSRCPPKDYSSIIASQRAEIESLKAQVKALKALGALARRTQRAPRATEKSERFGLIFQLREEDPVL